MRRLIAAFLLVLVSTVPAGAADKKLVIRWFGQSYFLLVTSAGTRIVIDPHMIDGYPRVVQPADLVLITHNHQDHSQLSVIENREQAKIMVGCKTVDKKQEWNPVDEKFKDVQVRTVGLYHDKTHGMTRGKNAAFVIEVDGLRIVHLGDLGHTLSDEQIKAIGPGMDILMIPVGGIYTIHGTDAKEVVKQLQPRRVVLPMHYGTKVFEDLPGPDEFLDEQKNVDRLLDTNELVITPDVKVSGPRIVVLGWKKKE
jgi:L-ascorbate metabolism protein UlaG (beta-lactamase superfamily)